MDYPRLTKELALEVEVLWKDAAIQVISASFELLRQLLFLGPMKHGYTATEDPKIMILVWLGYICIIL